MSIRVSSAFSSRVMRGFPVLVTWAVVGLAAATGQALAANINVTVSPPASGEASCSPNPAQESETVTCTATPAADYDFLGIWTGGCADSFAAPAGDLDCIAYFAQKSTLVRTLPSGGTADISIREGSGCTFANAQFVTPDSTPPGKQFPRDLFDFVLEGCAPGARAVVRIVYSESLPDGVEYWKFGPRPSQAAGWYPYAAADIDGDTIDLTITDGAEGDDDLSADGRIVDAGGPAIDVALLPQSIAWGPAPSVAVGGTGTLAATGGASGNPLLFSTLTPTTCSVSDNTVTGLVAGGDNCTVAANQAGNDHYEAAPQAALVLSVQTGAVSAPVPAPTLSEWSMALLIGLLIACRRFVGRLPGSARSVAGRSA